MNTIVDVYNNDELRLCDMSLQTVPRVGDYLEIKNELGLWRLRIVVKVVFRSGRTAKVYVK